jgi:mono/diheme cytochrome c family protein
MDFPIFDLGWVGNRFLFVVIAITHVLVNHALAVGLAPVVVGMEFLGIKEQFPDWDKLAYKIMKVAFIVTTTVGAMTGVGIWFSASLVNPNSIGSLIRVFFSAWFFEWLIFVTEVVLIMFYYLTWKSWTKGRAKLNHFKVGYGLAVFSWITMAVIVGILGFMMDPGNWNTERSLLNGFLNPIYLPQLVFRTFLAGMMGASFALACTYFFTEKDSEIRAKATRFTSGWLLVCAVPTIGGGLWYWSVIPEMMISNMSVALGMQQFQSWYEMISKLLVGGVLAVIAFAALTYLRPRWNYGKWAFILPIVVLWGTLGMFERVREFIRKPYVIGGYMYSNAYRVEDYPLLKSEGILKHATFVSTREVTDDNLIEAGKNVFMLSCSRCHTTNGVNAITDKFRTMYGTIDQPWDADAMKAYIRNMHNARYYMPPFPGNAKELEALVSYIKVLQYFPDPETHTFAQTSISPEENARLLAFLKEIEQKQKELAREDAQKDAETTPQ